MKSKRMKAAVFLRTNDVDKDDLFHQIAKCEDYARENNIQIEGAYTDFQTILKGKFDAVLVADKSRISRNAIEYKLKEQALNHKGMKIIIAGYDLLEQIKHQKGGFKLADKAQKALQKAVQKFQEAQPGERNNESIYEIAEEIASNSPEDIKNAIQSMKNQETQNGDKQ